MHKAIRVVPALALAASVAAGLSSRLHAAEAKKAQAKPIRVVILVGGHGYDQKTFPKAWGGHEDIHCEVWKGQPYTIFDDVAKFPYDAILMYNLTSGITAGQKANFLKLLKDGVGLIVWHHALANCQNWPEFERIAGCRFWLRAGERDGRKIPRSGTGFGRIPMHIADPNHPITKGMKDFEIQDEPYNHQTFAQGIHVLVTADHPKSDKPIAWALKYSGARVFGYQSGHDVRAWTNPGFRRLMANGIRWVAGRLGAEAAATGPADPFLGDWQGHWGKAGEGRRQLAAQVIPYAGGKYRINILPEFDTRGKPHAQVEAKADGNVLRFDQDGWTGRAEGGRLTGTGRRDGKDEPFEMKPVRRLSPRLGAKPPEGAVVLFDGTGFDHWEPVRGNVKAIPWKLVGSCARIWPPLKEHAFGPSICTRKAYPNFHLHLEFRLPLMPDVTGQTRANSGVIIEEYQFYEVQILDSYGLAGQSNECGALYGRAAPKVNMCAPPLQWQSYDILYYEPRFDAAGKLLRKARITVDHNGKLVQEDLELPYSDRALRGRGWRKPGRISLQHHGDPIEFRNIWLKELDPNLPRPQLR